MKHLSLSAIFFICMLSLFSILEAQSWHVFMYLDSSDNLNDMIIKNITDALKIPINDSVSFFIQLHAYDNIGLRYKITKDGLAFVDQVVLTGSDKQNFIDAATWGFANCVADNTMLVFGGHGFGILDPEWNALISEWQAGTAALSNSCSANQTESNNNDLGNNICLSNQVGMCSAESSSCSSNNIEVGDQTEACVLESNSCSVKKSMHRLYDTHCKQHRGFIFSLEPRSYLNNQDIIESLTIVVNKVLKGKKIDVIAFDTCMGGMLEVAYQLAPFTHYLVGNQVCALRDGFDYTNIMQALNQGPAPRDLAKELVQIFDNYYITHDNKGIYAHTALDMSQVSAVCQALDDVVVSFLERSDAAALALKAHTMSPRFCLFPMYTDVVSYVKSLESLLLNNNLTQELKDKMHDFYAQIQQFVVAHCAGTHSGGAGAQSCAIYLPTYAIYDSYKNTLFAQQTQWIKLLQCISDRAVHAAA